MSPKYLGAIDVALGSGAAGVFTNCDILWKDLEHVCIFNQVHINRMVCTQFLEITFMRICMRMCLFVRVCVCSLPRP